ncbi:MAG: carboxypeptidase-like regulatory domain-containing protein, partial [Actinobacteria bacterium]|nr:carboxypeptidase-like regulatory domain-containing protein [Actinomycetota bacterium]
NVAGGSPFTLEVRHPNNQLLVTVQTGTITSEGQVLPMTVVIPALGTVTGTVRYANASAAPSSAVELSGTGVTPKSGYASGAGTYTFTSVEGLRPLSVLARHPAANRAHIFAAGTGEIAAHAGSATVNVTLPGTGTASVTVTEFDGTTPIFGATVSILDSFSSQYRVEGATNASGVRTITIVPEGSFNVRAEIAGEEIGTATASVPGGAVGTVVPVLVSRSSEVSVEGTIFASDEVTPVPGAPVRLLDESGTTEIAFQTADSAGEFRFASTLPVGTSSILRAELPGEPLVTEETTVNAVTAGSTIVQNLSLPAKVLEGTVFESDGVTEVEGVSVEAMAVGGYAEGADATDSQGRFTIFGVADGDYELTATDPEGLRGFAPVTMGASDETVEKDVLLPAFGIVEGVVLDAAGAPPAGVSTTEVALEN